jgi:uncharacterized protein YecE (DUF72 family)
MRSDFHHGDQLHISPHSRAETIDNWKAQTPEEFRFALKAPQKITHWSKLRDCVDTLEYFCKVVTGLGERLGPVLFQLPPTFKKDADVCGSFLREFPAMRAAFEFRQTLGSTTNLRSAQIAQHRLCIADTDTILRQKITLITATSARREDYQTTDIERWAEFARQQESNWKDAFVYFKHEERHRAKTAQQMLKLLGDP